MQKIELLAPAGDLERLKVAIDYGADACYLGGQLFGLRAATKNFTIDEMKIAIEYAHKRGKKLYLVLNAIPHNEDIKMLSSYLEKIKDIPFDAYIVSDPGVIFQIKESIPDAEIHISTQANNTNYLSARFWYNQGASRIILARELSIEEISKMVEMTIDIPLEFECFVHGAMCISYSGRCLMSNYMSNRDANRGDCSQSCRWKYHLVEKTRPGEYYPIEEDEKGTYFFNSKDLCALPILDKIIKTGVKSLKVEGRNKSVYYVASIIRVYRKAIDSFYENEFNKDSVEEWMNEIKQVSHRDFTLGFFDKKADENDQNYGSSSYIRESIFIAEVIDYDKDNKLLKLRQKNKFFVGDDIEFIGPNYFSYKMKVKKMYDEKMNPINDCPHPSSIIYIESEEYITNKAFARKSVSV